MTSCSNTATSDVTVSNRHGLHLRAAGVLSGIAGKFQSEITIVKGRRSANAKSMLDLVSLSAAPGATLTINVEGVDAEATMQAILDFFNKQLGD